MPKRNRISASGAAMNHETFVREQAQARFQADTLPEQTIGDALTDPAALPAIPAPLATIIQELRITGQKVRIPLEAAHPAATPDITPAVDGLGVSRAIADLTTIALVRGDLRGMLAHLCHASVELLDAAAAGVVLFEARGETRLTAASDEMAFRAEARRVDALRAGDDPSPVGDAGLELWAVPMRANGEAIGSLDLYRRTADPMPVHEAEIARTLASVAAGLVWGVRAHERDRVLAEQLQRALDSRIVIEQAKGILSAQLGVTVDEAFEVLRSVTRSRGARIHQLATAVVERSIELGRPQPGWPASSRRSSRGPRDAA
jgi:ANTAR domain